MLMPEVHYSKLSLASMSEEREISSRRFKHRSRDCIAPLKSDTQSIHDALLCYSLLLSES